MSQSLVNLPSILAMAMLLSISTHRQILATSRPSAHQEAQLYGPMEFSDMTRILSGSQAQSEKEKEEAQARGISFRDYYRMHKKAVDRMVAEHDLQINNVHLADLTDFDEAHVPGLTWLVKLNLAYNRLNTLPANIFDGLANLRVLDLSYNRLTSLPSNIFNGLIALEELSLFINQLTTLPADIFKGLANLRELLIMNNELSSLDQAIFNDLIALRWLNLSNNKLPVLPANIFHNLIALVRLDISDNQLNVLPATIFNGLVALRWLDLSNNNLASIPANIFNGLHHIEDLLLTNNQITEFPTNILKEQDLRQLVLVNNPIAMSETQLRKKVGGDIWVIWFKDPKEEATERLLFKAINDGNAYEVEKRLAEITSGKYRLRNKKFPGPLLKEQDVSKVRDPNGNNLLQLVVKNLSERVQNMRSEITKIKNEKNNSEEEKKTAADVIGQQIKAAEDLYAKIFVIIAQSVLSQAEGSSGLQEMLLSRDKNGYDVVGSAVGALGKNSTFVRALISFEHQPTTPAKRFLIKPRVKTTESEAEEVEKGLAEQRKQLEPQASSALPTTK